MKTENTGQNLVEKTFEDQSVVFIEMDGDIWITGDELGKVLGYKNPRTSIWNIANRKPFIKENFTKTVRMKTNCGMQNITVYSEVGAYIICLLSKSKKAQSFVVCAAKSISEIKKNQSAEKKPEVVKRRIIQYLWSKIIAKGKILLNTWREVWKPKKK